jgi:3-hydroxy-D-aspartate aldolase
MQAPPAKPGMTIGEIDTPALIVDLDALESNLDRMSAILDKGRVRLRAHAKTHKSPVIAHMQIARGAAGQCVQKVAEAEALAFGGVRDILVSNEVVCPQKLARLAALTHIANVALCADSLAGIEAAASAARDAQTTLTVLVEVNVGGERCGVSPGGEAVALAQAIAASPHLRFGGIQAYHGRAQHVRDPAERKAAAVAAARAAAMTVEQLKQAGLSCETIGGAGTGTFMHDLESGVYNELQAGSYCFMDADYARNSPDPDDARPGFRQALFVLSSVMSVPRPGIAVVDAGHKAVAVDSGLPLVFGRPELSYVSASDEHGKLTVSEEKPAPRLGERLLLVPGHCDPTVDRFDWYVVIKKERVVGLWPVAARGAMS